MLTLAVLETALAICLVLPAVAKACGVVKAGLLGRTP